MHRDIEIYRVTDTREREVWRYRYIHTYIHIYIYTHVYVYIAYIYRVMDVCKYSTDMQISISLPLPGRHIGDLVDVPPVDYRLSVLYKAHMRLPR